MRRINSIEQLEAALWNEELTLEEAEDLFPGWVEKMKSEALNDLAEESNEDE